MKDVVAGGAEQHSYTFSASRWPTPQLFMYFLLGTVLVHQVKGAR